LVALAPLTDASFGTPRARPGQNCIRAIILALVFRPTTAHAQIPIVQSGPASLQLSGYVRALTGIHDAGFDVPGTPGTTGFHGEVIRLKWQLALGERFTLIAHNRLQAQITSAASSFGSVAGFGVSVVPGRPVDLTTHLVEEERLDVWHDVDRLALTVRTGFADVTVGRQAITWGISSLFPIADLWAQFSPFELDTEEKPGSDAVRVLSYPIPGVELDAIVAARGRAEDWSTGLRATVDLADWDLYAAAGKFWNQVVAMAGANWVLDRVKLRAEAALPYDLDLNDWERLRATVGLDWLSARMIVTAEYHHNGVGAADPSGYLATVTDPRVQRGETYYLGRHYLGGAVSYVADEESRLSLTGSALWNVEDGSVIVTPIASYDFGQSTSVSLGALQSFGATPTIVPPALRSEFGTYGALWFSRVSVYF
jgi:hypothetical protein